MLLFVSFLFFSCSNRQTTKFSDEALYIIDLDGNKEESIPYSSIFQKVQTIILETGEDCMIGSVDELQVFNGYIYILDRHIAKSLFVFDMEGRFIRKIGSLGSGPGEYIRVTDFTLDTENSVIFMLDYGTRVHKYCLDGTYIHSITLQIPRANSRFIQYYKGILFASVLAWEPAKDDYMLLGIDPNDGKILSQHLPLKYNKGWSESVSSNRSFFMSRLNSHPKYAQLFMDCIVSLDEEVSPYIEIKSKNLVTEKDIENIPNEDPDIFKMLSHFQGSLKIWEVHDLIENDDFIIFNYCSGLFNNYFTVVFHKKTTTVKIVNKLSNDLILRQVDNNKIVRPTQFKFSDMQGVYEIILPYRLERFQQSIKNNEIVPDLDKLDQLKKLDEESNPVIFFYEFK